jgi:hypothetical protein
MTDNAIGTAATLKSLFIPISPRSRTTNADDGNDDGNGRPLLPRRGVGTADLLKWASAMFYSLPADHDEVGDEALQSARSTPRGAGAFMSGARHFQPKKKAAAHPVGRPPFPSVR